jgi:hypothetical protein
MKYPTRKSLLKYTYDQLTGSFIGFLLGMAATRLVSRFFVTKSIRNLWGLTAKKRVIDKQTFHYLELIISIVIGFIVFEIVTKVIKKKIDEKFPIYKFRFLRWMVRNKSAFKVKENSLYT